MTENIVITYRQVPINAPPAFSKVVTPDLFSSIKMKAVDVLFKKAQDGADWSGFCYENDFTETGEVVIDIKWVQEHIYEPSNKNILKIYLHECAHRLLPDMSHNAVFFALNLLLFLRADKHSKNLFHTMNLYDIQDETDIPKCLDWAYQIAHKYVDSNKTAEECAEIFSTQYTEWCTWIDGADARAATTRKKWLDLHERVRDLLLQRWMFLVVGCLLGLLIRTLIV
ncbi:MAG: hypothetical protein K2Y28_05950 [Burkholderiaceae bacterium]|nr:hypothetical protein [Burkholderiaceae bacterium]